MELLTYKVFVDVSTTIESSNQDFELNLYPSSNDSFDYKHLVLLSTMRNILLYLKRHRSRGSDLHPQSLVMIVVQRN